MTNSTHCSLQYMQVSHSVCHFLCLSLILPLLQEDDDGPILAPEYDTISENGLLSRNEPIRSKVSKLTEKLRKRYPTTSTGQPPLTYPLLFSPSLLFSLYLSDKRAFDHKSHIDTFLLSYKGNCSSCSAVFSVLKKRVRLRTC